MTKDEIEKQLVKDFGEHIEIQTTDQPEPFLYVTKEKYVEFCKYLTENPSLAFDFLFQLGGAHFVDASGQGEKFEAILCLASSKHKHEMVLKVKLPAENLALDTVTGIWRVADFYELEAMELYGIKFPDHPHPRRLLLDDDWDYGYPMRKGWSGHPDFIPMPDKSESAE